MGEQLPICISFAWLRHVGECGGHPFVVFSFVVINPQHGHNSSKMFTQAWKKKAVYKNKWGLVKLINLIPLLL